MSTRSNDDIDIVGILFYFKFDNKIGYPQMLFVVNDVGLLLEYSEIPFLLAKGLSARFLVVGLQGLVKSVLIFLQAGA